MISKGLSLLKRDERLKASEGVPKPHVESNKEPNETNTPHSCIRLLYLCLAKKNRNSNPKWLQLQSRIKFTANQIISHPTHIFIEKCGKIRYLGAKSDDFHQYLSILTPINNQRVYICKCRLTNTVYTIY